MSSVWWVGTGSGHLRTIKVVFINRKERKKKEKEGKRKERKKKERKGRDK